MKKQFKKNELQKRVSYLSSRYGRSPALLTRILEEQSGMPLRETSIIELLNELGIEKKSKKFTSYNPEILEMLVEDIGNDFAVLNRVTKLKYSTLKEKLGKNHVGESLSPYAPSNGYKGGRLVRKGPKSY